MHDTWLIFTMSYFGWQKQEKMAEELQKYKDILAREQKEPEACVTINFVLNFCNFPLLDFILCFLYNGSWILFKGIDPEMSGYEVALAYTREKQDLNQKRYAIFFFFEHMVLIKCLKFNK